jgi:hypothetical protein
LQALGSSRMLSGFRSSIAHVLFGYGARISRSIVEAQGDRLLVVDNSPPGAISYSFPPTSIEGPQ